MEELLQFFQTYGLPITLIAIGGIIILGVLKYTGMFKKLDEKYRHYIYIGISIGISVIATVIYLACVGQLTVEYFAVVVAAIYALNQTFYNIFDVTPINKLFKKLLDIIVEFVKTKILKRTTDETSDGAGTEEPDASEDAPTGET